MSALTTQDLLNSYARELILLGGKDATGKSSAVVSMASLVEMIDPDAKFYVIDTENKFSAAVRSFGDDAPRNLVYYKVDNMEQAIDANDEILGSYKPGDWLAVESMWRMWEKAQNLGYLSIAGVNKPEWMKAKKGTVIGGIEKKGPTPDPKNLWDIIKGAHEGRFLSPICSLTDLNVLMTTLIVRPREPDSPFKENPAKKAFRAETGYDANIGGSPNLPSYFQTVMALEMFDGKIKCRVIRDNNSKREDTKPEFDVPDRMSWAQSFWQEAR